MFRRKKSHPKIFLHLKKNKKKSNDDFFITENKPGKNMGAAKSNKSYKIAKTSKKLVK